MSKFVTAAGVMKLVELGKIDLDAPISKYLTRWKLPPSAFDNEQVTVRRLLSHTAGLTDELGYSGFENPDAVQTLESSLTKAADADAGISGVVKVGIEPNTAWKYSGGGFTLLQLIVEETRPSPHHVWCESLKALPWPKPVPPHAIASNSPQSSRNSRFFNDLFKNWQKCASPFF